MIRVANLLLLTIALLIGGCSFGQPRGTASGQTTSAAKLADCRQRADEVYAKQNRAELYRSDSYTTSNLDSPYSTSGLPGVTTRGLSSQYARDSLISDCVDDAAGNVGSNGAEPAAAAKATVPP